MGNVFLYILGFAPVLSIVLGFIIPNIAEMNSNSNL